MQSGQGVLHVSWTQRPEEESNFYLKISVCMRSIRSVVKLLNLER